MKRSSGPWLLGGLLTIAGVGIVSALKQEASSCQPVVGPGSRIMLVGDSLAVGLQVPLGQLARTTGSEFAAFSQSGSTIRRWVRDAQVSATLGTFKPTVVLVCLGTNDSLGNQPTEVLASQISEMKDWLQESGAAVVWILPPKLPFPERVSGAIKAAGVKTFVSANLPLPQPDGIHSTGKGYAGWAEHIWAFLSCSSAPKTALSGIGPAPRRPVLPSFMQPARVPSSKNRRAKRRRMRV